MELAALLALGLEDWIDFGVIVGILLLNAFVGYYQEKQAADIVASLKGDIAMKTTVVRDGQEQVILARELVPGDIVCFRIQSILFELNNSLTSRINRLLFLTVKLSPAIASLSATTTTPRISRSSRSSRTWTSSLAKLVTPMTRSLTTTTMTMLDLFTTVFLSLLAVSTIMQDVLKGLH